jgi:hypothetical protein
MRDKWGHENTHKFVECDLKECGAYLQYKKRKNDPAMPKGLAERRQRCVDWMGRPSPTSSPCQSDDENDDFNKGGHNHNKDAVQGLLDMAATHTQQPNIANYLENNGEDSDDEYGWSGKFDTAAV